MTNLSIHYMKRIQFFIFCKVLFLLSNLHPIILQYYIQAKLATEWIFNTLNHTIMNKRLYLIIFSFEKVTLPF